MLTTLILSTAAAWACLSASPGEFVLDSAVEDDVPPRLEEKDSDVSVWRGIGPTCTADGGVMSTSCDDRGVISVSIAAAVDEGASLEPSEAQVQAGVGYRLRIVSGAPPDGLWLAEAPQNVFLVDGRASFSIHWGDEAEDEQEAFDFVLGIQAIDLAGNLSEELLIDISDPGRSAEAGSCGAMSSESGKSAGCAAVGGLGASLLLAGLAGLGAGRRRLG